MLSAVSGTGSRVKRAVNGTAGVGMFGATVNASTYATTVSTASAPIACT